MNTLNLINNKISMDTKDLEIELIEKKSQFDILKININCNKKTKLKIIQEDYEDLKVDIVINVKEDLDIVEINKIKNTKIRYIYNIEENKNLNIIKFYYGKNLREQDIINLKENSKVDFNLKLIAEDKQKIGVIINHDGKNSVSNITNRGVMIEEGFIKTSITSIVEKGITGCIANQFSKVISLNEQEAVISPTFLIEEEAETNHKNQSDIINNDKINDYKTDDISHDDAKSLLIKEFLKEEDEFINNIIDEYWR